MQKRFFNYKDIIKSFDANQRDFAIAPSGVYAGFDEIQDATVGEIPVASGDVGIRFLHTTTAKRFVDAAGDDTLLSCVKSEQGAIITESTHITLPITIEPTLNRIDAIVLRHAYTEVVGGAVATYEVVPGTEGVSTPPTISIDTERTVIGWVLVKSGATDASGMEWLRKETPSFGERDMRLNTLAMNALLTVAEHDTVLTFTGNTLDFPFTGNIYTIKSRTTSAQNTVHQLPHRTSKVFKVAETGAVLWLRVAGDSDAPLTLFDVNEMLDMGAIEPDDNYKWIKTGSGAAISVQNGGIIQLIERADYWEVSSVFDYLTHPYTLSDKLNNKGVWWLESGFVSATRAALGQTLEVHGRRAVNVNESGLIEIGTVAQQRNILDVTVPLGVEEIFGTNATFKFSDSVVADGAEVILKFVAVAEGKTVLRLGASANHFKAENGFDYVVKQGSFVRCLQTSAGLQILNGEPYINWITPSNVSAQFDIPVNGIQYAVYPDGFIRFRGNIEILANSAFRKVFSLPSVFDAALFQADFLRLVSVADTVVANTIHNLRFGNYDGGGWGIYYSNVDIATISMESVAIPYRI